MDAITQMDAIAQMDATAWLTIAAILLGPIVAVRLTRYLDDKKKVRERKLQIFKALMATRAAVLSQVHFDALNLIDLEFDSNNRKEKQIIEAWKAYLDHLNTEYDDESQWNLRRIDFLVELLYKMSIVLKFQFDKTHIKNACYVPRAHEERHDNQNAITRAFRDLLEGRRVIPIQITNLPPPSQQVETDDLEIESAGKPPKIS